MPALDAGFFIWGLPMWYDEKFEGWVKERNPSYGLIRKRIRRDAMILVVINSPIPIFLSYGNCAYAVPRIINDDNGSV